jgi:hypothetical protein
VSVSEQLERFGHHDIRVLVPLSYIPLVYTLDVRFSSIRLSRRLGHVSCRWLHLCILALVFPIATPRDSALGAYLLSPLHPPTTQIYGVPIPPYHRSNLNATCTDIEPSGSVKTRLSHLPSSSGIDTCILRTAFRDLRETSNRPILILFNTDFRPGKQASTVSSVLFMNVISASNVPPLTRGGAGIASGRSHLKPHLCGAYYHMEAPIYWSPSRGRMCFIGLALQTLELFATVPTIFFPAFVPSRVDLDISRFGYALYIPLLL